MLKNTFPTREIEILSKNFTFLARAEYNPATGDYRTARCRGCHALIFFAKTSKGKFIPLDADSQDGLFTPHFATCPFAGELRKLKK